MSEVRNETGLKIITEVTSEHALEAAVNYVDNNSNRRQKYAEF